MTISPLCPETNLPCSGRQWLIEAQQAQDLSILDADIHVYSDNPRLNRLAKIYDKIGGHTGDRKRAGRQAQSAVEASALMHEQLSHIPDRRLCEGDLCGTMAQVICDNVMNLRP